MPFNQLRTDKTSGNEYKGHTIPYAPLIDSIERSRAKVADHGINLSTGPTIELIKEAVPKYANQGAPNLIYSIVNSRDEDSNSTLNHLTRDLIENAINEDPALAQRYQEEPERREIDFQKMRNHLRNSVLQDTYTGEDIATSISNRSLDLRTDREKSSKATIAKGFAPSSQFEKHYDQEFVTKVSEISGKLGLDMQALFAVMDFESRGTFSPSVRNADSTATGLIQFMESTARELGTSTESLANMSQIEQLEYVEKYLSNTIRERGQIRNADDLYMAVLWPAAIGRDRDSVLWTQGSETNGRFYDANKSLDSTGKGYITVGDAAGFIERRVEGNEYFHSADTTTTRKVDRISQIDVPVSDYLSIIERRPERYPNLVDGETKRHIFDGTQGTVEDFKSYLKANPATLEALERDRFDNFKAELGKRHNVAPMIESDPNHMARAYAVYDRFGAEGLTQYSNYFEEYNPDLPIDRQNQKFVKAHNFLERERVGGISPREWMYVFTGEEGSPFGKFQIDPVKPSIYTEIQFPKGWNTFTSTAYDHDDRTGKFTRKSAYDQIKTLFERYVHSDEQPTSEEISEIVTGIGGDEYFDLVWEVRKNASTLDLIDNLRANLEYDESSGYPRYLIRDVDNLPMETRVAIDALQTMNEFGSAFYRSNDEDIGGSETLIFEPHRTHRVRDGQTANWFSPANLFHALIRTEQAPIKDNDGNILGFEEVPATGFWNQLWNTGVTGNIKAYEFSRRFILEPAAFLINTGIETVDKEAGLSFEAFWDETFGEWDAYDLDGFFSFRKNTVPRLNMLAIDMAGYLAAFKAYGSIGVLTAGKFAKKVNDISKGRELARVHLASHFGRTGRDYGKWELLAQRASGEFAKKGNRLIAAQFALGDALVQPVTQGEIGFFKHGILGEEAEEWYKRSNYFARTFADIGFNSLVGFAGDALFSSFPAVKAGWKAKRGDKTSEIYKSLFTKEGDSYYAQFLDFMSENLNALPVGEVTQSAANAFRGNGFLLDRTKISSLADVVHSIKHDAGGYLSNMRKDISETVKHYDLKFTGKVRDNLDETVDKIFNDSIDEVGRHLARIASEQSSNIPGLSNAFQLGRLFETHSGQLREVVEVSKGRAQRGRLYDLAEANQVASEGPNRIVRREPDVVLGDGAGVITNKYRVYEAVDESWGVHLGHAIKRHSLEDGIETSVSRRLADIKKSRGTEATPGEIDNIRQTVEEVFGAPYISPKTGQLGYITDTAADGMFMIRLDDGRLAKAAVDKTSLHHHFSTQLNAGQITREEFDRLGTKYFLDFEDAATRAGLANVFRQARENLDNMLSAEMRSATNAANYDAVDQYMRIRKSGADEFLSALNKPKAPGLLRSARKDMQLVHVPKEPELPKGSMSRSYDKARKNAKTIEELTDQSYDDFVERALRDLHYNPTKWGFGRRVLNQIQGWTGATMKMTSEMAMALARNLGVDDLAIHSTRSPKGKMLFGRNQGELKTWEPLRKTGGNPTIPKGTLVEYGSIDGVPRIFYANKRTKLEPSRWIAEPGSGKPVRNPDWDQLNSNETIDGVTNALRFYIRDENSGMYRPVKPESGEMVDAVAINVQHPLRGGEYSKGAAKKYERHFTDSDFIERGWDAIEYRVNGEKYYRLIDENSQAVNPRGVFMDNMNIAEIVEAVPVQAGMGGAIKGTLLGGFAGSLAGGLSEEYDASELGGAGSLIGLGLGLLAGRRTRATTRSATQTAKKQVSHVKKITQQTKKGDEYYDPAMQREIEVDEMRFQQNQRPAFEGDIRVREEVRAYDSAMKMMESFAAAGKDMLSWAKHSKYTQAPIQFFRKMNSQTGQKLGDILYNTDNMPRKWLANIQRNYDGKYGRDAWEQDMRLLNDETTEFLTAHGVDVRDKGIQRILGSGNAAYDQWNEAMVRVITGQGQLSNGKLVYNGRQNVVNVYSGPNGQAYRALDEHLLKNERFLHRAKVIKDAYKVTRKRTMDAYSNKLQMELDALAQVNLEHHRVLSKFVSTKQNFGEYIKGVSDEAEKKLLRQAVESTIYGRSINEVQTSKSKFTELGDSYVTQIHSRPKMEEYRRRWSEQYRRDNPTASSSRAGEAFDEHMFNEFKELNTHKKGKPRHFNSKTNDLDDITAESREKVRGKLLDIFEEAGDEARPILNQRVDEMIVDLGRRTRVNSKNQTETYNLYGVRDPIDTLERNAYNRYNDVHLRSLYENVMDGIVIRNSNFLERPRSFEIPFHWMETDMDKILRRYARDTQPRIMWMEEGVFNIHDFRRNFSKPISDELKQAGVEPHVIDKFVGRTNSIFNMQTGMAHRLAAMSGTSHADKVRQLHRMSLWEKFTGFIRNVNFMPFGYYISVYDTFQPFIHGAMLGSLSSTFRTTKHFLANPQALKNAEWVSKLNNASMRKMEAYLANFQRDFSDVAGATPFERRMGKLDSMSGRGADAAARMSITRGVMWAGSKLTGGWIRPDLENWGLARLFFDSFYGVNSVSTTMNWYAGLLELQRLSQIRRQFAKSPDTVQISGMSRADVDRKFTLIGIPESKINRFVENDASWNRLLTEMDSADFSMKFFDDHPGMYNDLSDVIAHMTDSYHGKSRMFRPEAWSTEVGRVLSQYKIYPFNFAMQNYNRRIADPIRAWDAQFGQNIGGIEIGKILSKLAKNDIQGLRKMGLTDEAINQFPVESYKSILKMVYAVNASAAMFITRDAMMDIMEAPLLSEEDQWSRLQRRGIINPNAPQEQQKTWADLIQGSGFEKPADFFTILRGYAGYAARTGTWGIYGDFLENSRLQNDGIANLSIAGSMANEFIKSGARILDSDPGQMSTNVSREILSHTLQRTPIAGSLGGGRRHILNSVFESELNKPKNANISFVESSTGQTIDRRLLFGAFD